MMLRCYRGGSATLLVYARRGTDTGCFFFTVAYQLNQQLLSFPSRQVVMLIHR